MIIEHARARAEAAFKKKQQARVEGERATTEYKEQQLTMQKKTARLRALRLARDEARNNAAPTKGMSE
jgi:hypothetical protein